MSTPYGGDPNTGWQSPGQQPGTPPAGSPPPGFPPQQQPYPQQPAPGGYGQPDYSQVQPNYGQPYGGGPAPAQLAGFWIRFGGALIDGILLGIVGQIFVRALGTGTGTLLQYVLQAAYFTYFHASTGQSLGNKVVGIKIIDQTTGGNIDYVRAFTRWIVSIVSAIPIALGYLWMLWDPAKQTWHDKAAKTVVIRTK